MIMNKNEEQKVIENYCRSLLNNDLKDILSLFAGNATVFSDLSGENSAADFFRKLFDMSTRKQVKLKNIFFSLDSKTVAVWIELDVIFSKQDYNLQFEAIDIFEFDNYGKISKLKIIRDTYPVRAMLKDDGSHKS
jgi:hypothetical protein